jgi:serine-type D-Ala-D-Ala carboxypeptidase (penicillin-binding protein 5/6)
MALVLVLVPGVSRLNQARAQEATQGTPKLQAESWALTDADTGLYLAGKNPDERLPIASTTKVMVALVALDEGVDLDEEVTVPKEAERFVGFTYSNVGLIAGERLSVRDLLVAALVPSGTDAVYTLAKYLGDGSVQRFVQKMNAKASVMGLKNTHFEDPAGLDARGHYSSARDLAAITRAAMEYPVFDEIVQMKEATIKTQNRHIELFNTNNLLYTYPEATGVKTGTSPEAGPCLVASAKEGEESYIAVVLDAKDEDYRFEGAQVALGYGFESFDRRPLVEEGKVYEESPLPYRRGESVGLAAEEDVLGLTGPGLEAERRITEKKAPPSARAGQELGTVEVLEDGKSVGSSPLVTEEGYEEASLWQKIKYWVGGLVERVSG